MQTTDTNVGVTSTSIIMIVSPSLASLKSPPASFFPSHKYTKSLIMDRPVSMVAVVAALRYNQWEGPGVFRTPTEVWVSADKLFHSKRRFYLRTNIEEFKDLLRGDPFRIAVWDTEQTMWVRAV